jgi:hypothetical protein
VPTGRNGKCLSGSWQISGGGDPGRPELTPERIRELLRLLLQIYEREPAIGKFLFRPALPDESGKSARRLDRSGG